MNKLFKLLGKLIDDIDNWALNDIFYKYKWDYKYDEKIYTNLGRWFENSLPIFKLIIVVYYIIIIPISFIFKLGCLILKMFIPPRYIP